MAVVLTAFLIAACGGSSGSSASLPPLHPGIVGPESMVTEASGLINNPTGDIAQLKALGVDRVHIPLQWSHVAPDVTSTHKPAVDLANPASYPASGWAPYDTVVKDLKAAHIGIDLAVTWAPPRWAEGKGAPHPATQTEWEPSAADYGDFVRAVATRYSGHYTPPGASTPLPRVNFWSIWNEPDLGANLAPEVNKAGLMVAPRYYRAFADAAWTAFHATGHGRDTILFGELAPAGIHSGTIGYFNSMPPLQFLRALYCVDKNYKPLQGQAATEIGCPATATASAQFKARNPVLFHASGVAYHPYPQGLPPNQVTPNEPDYAELADTPTFEKALDRTQQAYGSTTKFPLWDTEFGYQTTPPDPESGTVSQTTAARYMNWAEYIHWLDPRIRSYDQYLLMDPPAGNFATGLMSPSGAPKPGYYAFRMPLYLPVTSTQKGHPLVVWGCVRPAPAAAKAAHKRQVVDIQYSSGSAGAFRTVQTVPLTNIHGYFEVRHTFPGSGTVRLAWTPPHGPQMFSRTVAITLR